jgi:hypothetical protein
MHIPLMNRVLPFAVAGLAMAVLSSPVAASTPIPATGTFSITITPQTVSFDGGNTFISYSLLETITGTVSGTRVGAGTLVVHPDGTFDAQDSGIFTGTIDGVAGTANLAVTATGIFGVSVTGQALATAGAGGLTGAQSLVHFNGAATSPVSFAGTYSGQAQFGAP